MRRRADAGDAGSIAGTRHHAGCNEGYEFRGIQFVHKGKRVAADFPEGKGMGLRRPLLHAMLVAKAEHCGVRLLWKTPVSAISPEGVQLKNGLVQARWIVGADGGGSRVRRWSGLEASTQRTQRYATRRHYRMTPWSDYAEIHWGERAQAYVTPIGRLKKSASWCWRNISRMRTSRRCCRSCRSCASGCAGAELASRERGAITVNAQTQQGDARKRCAGGRRLRRSGCHHRRRAAAGIPAGAGAGGGDGAQRPSGL